MRYLKTVLLLLFLGLFSTALFSLEIHDAVKSGDLAKVKALLEKDPGLVNAKAPNGMTPLFVACIEKKGLEMVRYLGDHGAGVNVFIKYGGTLLDMAYEYSGPEYVQYLESKGARYSPIDLRLSSVRGAVSRITHAWGMLNNIAVSAGPDGILIVDSGFSQRATGGLTKLLAGLNKGELRIIVNSHPHGDHTAGNILAGPRVKMIDAGVLRNPAAGSGLAPAAGPLQGPSGKAFEGNSVLRFNGEDILFIPYPGLHSDADILTYFSGSGVVHMGDLLLSQCGPAVQDVGGYMAFLDKAIDIFPKDTIFISGHGRDLTMDGLKKYRADLAAMIAVVKKNFDEGKSAAEMLKVDVLKDYKADYSFLDWLGPDSWLARVVSSLKSGWRPGQKSAAAEIEADQNTPPYDPLKKFPVEALQSDLETLWNILEEGHAGFDRYTPLKELRKLFDEARAGIATSLTEADFYLKLLPLAAAVKDGHTRLRLSPAAQDFLKAQPVFFPFELRFLGGKAFVFRNLSADPTVTEGSELLAVNGIPMGEILSKLLSLIPNDAGIQTRKLRQLEYPEIFGRLFALSFGRPDSYALRIRPYPSGEPREISVPGIKGADIVPTLHKRYPDAARKLPRYEFSIRGTTAILTIRAFEDDEDKGKPSYPQFLKDAFGQVADKKIANLIIDLRGNGGGADAYGKLLFAYVADNPFMYYRALESKKDRYDLFKYTTLSKAEEEELAKRVRKNDRGWYDVLGHPNLGLQPPQHPHFAGKVAILIDGLSFSATGETTSLYHYHHKAVFFGEECGAGYYGNTSGFMPTATLPNSGLQIRVPMILYTMAVDGYPQDRGIVPEVPVSPTIEDLLAGRDPVMDRALKFLKDNETAARLAPGEARELMDAHARDPHFVVLDVRTPEEFDGGHLTNALNIDIKAPDFAERVGTLNRSDLFLVYCRGGGRSFRALGILKSKGFSRVYDLVGGILKWQEANLPVVKEEKKNLPAGDGHGPGPVQDEGRLP